MTGLHCRSLPGLLVLGLFIGLVGSPGGALPLSPFGSHSGEDHSGELHAGEYLEGIDLSFADLSGSDFSFVDLTSADLSGADLSSIILTGSTLVGAIAVGADLSDSNLVGLNLSGADLTGADLSGSNLTGTIYDLATLLPAGFDPIGEAMILVPESGTAVLTLAGMWGLAVHGRRRGRARASRR